MSRISSNRAKMFIRCFMAEVTKLVNNCPDMGLSMEDVDEASLMLDIIESVEPPTRAQVQSISSQVSNVMTTLKQHHTNMAITTEILCFMVQAIREHASTHVADMFQSWTPGSCGPYSSSSYHSYSSNSRTARRSPDPDEFCARIDPVEEITPASPRPRSSSLVPLINEAAPPPPQTNSLPPCIDSTPPPSPNDKSNWQVPSDWNAQRGGSRKLRREGAFMHTPDWEAMKNVYGRRADDAGDASGDTSTRSGANPTRLPSTVPCAESSRGDEQPIQPSHSTRFSNSNSQANADTHIPCAPLRRADSSASAELERRITDLQAHIDAGFEGKLPTYHNQMKEGNDVAGSTGASSSSKAPLEPSSPTSTTPSTAGKKRSRSHSQSPSTARSSPSPSSPTDTATTPGDDEDTSAESRSTKRRRVSPAPLTLATSSSTPGQAVYRIPAPTPVPEPSSALSASTSAPRSGSRTRTPVKRTPLPRTATMANFD
ncbi:hypothetical protein J3A83DRAFT_4189874 [Scleroderma citrinum]